MPHQVLEQAGQRGQAAAHRRSGGAFLLAHDPLPGDHRAMIDLAQLVGRGDAERAHEVRHVLLVGAAGAGALLAGKPDFFLGDRGQVVEAGELAGAGWSKRAGQGSVMLLNRSRPST